MQWRYQRYEEACTRLGKEIDIVGYVTNMRTSRFLAKLFLKNHQRALVNSFSKYQLDDMDSIDEKAKVIDRKS